MSSPGLLEQVKPQGPGSGRGVGNWIVTVFNNDYNTWDEVTGILMRATNCSPQEAEIETWEIDKLGKSVVHHGQEDECHDAASVIARIGIRVEVSCE